MNIINLKQLRKIPFIDLLGVGIFFLILFIAAFFFLRRSEYVIITVKISDRKEKIVPWVHAETPDWYLENLHEGIVEKDMLGKINIKVEKVYFYPTINSDETVFANLMVRATYNKRTGQYVYKGSPLLVGGYNDFNVEGLKISGLITKIGNNETEKRLKKFIIKGFLDIASNGWIPYPAETSAEGIDKYLSEKIVNGLEVRRSDGRLITKILEVKKSPAYRKYIYRNSLVNSLDYDRENVDLTLEVEALQIGNKYYYREETPIHINTLLSLHFEDFWIGMTVTDINEITN